MIYSDIVGITQLKRSLQLFSTIANANTKNCDLASFSAQNAQLCRINIILLSRSKLLPQTAQQAMQQCACVCVCAQSAINKCVQYKLCSKR